MKMSILCPKKMKHCRKVAEALADAFNIECFDMEEISNIPTTDLLIIVCGGVSSGEDKSGIEGYIKKVSKDRVKSVGLVILDSNWNNISRIDGWKIGGGADILKKILDEKDIPVIDQHMCESQFNIFCIGHPNKRDIQKSVDWLQKLQKQIS